MNNKKKIGLYNPYLATMGGGERLILSILQVLESEGYEISIFWDENLSEEIQNKLGITFRSLQFVSNIFKHSGSFEKIKALSSYDMFFYVPDGSYFFSSAQQNFIYSMVPNKALYRRTLLNKIKLYNWKFITISEFSKKCLSDLQIPSQIIYPYLPTSFFEPILNSKEKIILNVGRFFKQLHSKRQDIAITWFKDLQKMNPAFAEYKLILAGSCMPEDEAYLAELRELAGDDPQIEFRINESFDTLLGLYDQAEYYWHMAGYGVDEAKNPEQTEHLGITPMEAMARGCLTFAYNAGGPKEIIQDHETGFLFSSQEELFQKMSTPQEKKDQIIQRATQYVSEHFSYDIFKQNVLRKILNSK